MQPPWWLALMFAPSVAVALAGVALLAGRQMNLSDPWAAIGLGFAAGGGGSCLILLLSYWRWRLSSIECRSEVGAPFRVTFRQVARMYNQPSDPYTGAFFDLNPDVRRWFEHYPSTLLLVPLWRLPVVLFRMLRGRRP